LFSKLINKIQANKHHKIEQLLIQAKNLQESFQDSYKAIDVYNQILKLDPAHLDCLGNLTVLYHQLGKKQDALDACRKIIDFYPDNANAYNNYAVFLRELGDLDGAIAALQKALSLDNEFIDAHYNLGLTFLDKGNFTDAIRPLTTVSNSVTGHYSSHANLARALYESGQASKALIFGKRALEEKDKESCSHFQQYEEFCRSQVSRNKEDVNLKNIISFSLWGDNLTYTKGAIENVRLSKDMYPGWICRFYYDNSVPTEIISELELLGAEVVQVKDTKLSSLKSFWRFFVSDDDTVDRFICRDCDSRLNLQEKAAVEEWVQSGKHFHIMRDSMFHTELILSGMWGGVSRLLPNMVDMIDHFYLPNQDKWMDQHFLRLMIWPQIKDKALTHDSYYQFGNNAKEFPLDGRLPDHLHVGIGYKLE
jgi:Tfp pilus assembly protein PilF